MWKLTQFGEGGSATDLSAIYNRKENQGTPSVPTRLIKTASGWYDPLGSRVAKQMAPLISLEGELYAANMLTEIQDLTGEIGKKDKLYRALEDGSTQWCYARLMGCDISREWPRSVYPLKLAFEATGPWQGSYNYHSDTLDVSGGSDSTVVSVGGNTRQNNVNLIVRPTSSGQTMSSCEISCAAMGIDLLYTDNVAYNKDLEIDSETASITNDGVDAFDVLTMSLHALDRFLALDPGDLTFEFSTVGVNQIKVYIEFYDAWA